MQDVTTTATQPKTETKSTAAAMTSDKVASIISKLKQVKEMAESVIYHTDLQADDLTTLLVAIFYRAVFLGQPYKDVVISYGLRGTDHAIQRRSAELALDELKAVMGDLPFPTIHYAENSYYLYRGNPFEGEGMIDEKTLKELRAKVPKVSSVTEDTKTGQLSKPFKDVTDETLATRKVVARLLQKPTDVVLITNPAGFDELVDPKQWGMIRRVFMQGGLGRDGRVAHNWAMNLPATVNFFKLWCEYKGEKSKLFVVSSGFNFVHGYGGNIEAKTDEKLPQGAPRPFSTLQAKPTKLANLLHASATNWYRFLREVNKEEVKAFSLESADIVAYMVGAMLELPEDEFKPTFKECNGLHVFFDGFKDEKTEFKAVSGRNGGGTEGFDKQFDRDRTAFAKFVESTSKSSAGGTFHVVESWNAAGKETFQHLFSNVLECLLTACPAA
jgi:hypothetical protein